MLRLASLASYPLPADLRFTFGDPARIYRRRKSVAGWTVQQTPGMVSLRDPSGVTRSTHDLPGNVRDAFYVLMAQLRKESV